MKQLTFMGCSLEEKQLADKKIEALAEVFTKPTQAKLEGGGSLRGNALIERMIKLKKAECNQEIDKAVNELTDAEILANLSNASLKMPLNAEAFETMKYYFKRVKGEKAFKEIFGDEQIRMDYVKEFQKIQRMRK